MSNASRPSYPSSFSIPITFLLYFLLLTSTPCASKDLKLLILHNNDMHSRFEETAPASDTCPDSQKNKSCVGGFARTAHAIRGYRNLADRGQLDGRNVIFLNAGDTFVGTSWYGVHKWNICAEFLNLLKPDAITLGNHEFDEGELGVMKFVELVKCPIVVANIDTTLIPSVKKSVILEVDGRKIGVIGHVLKETMQLSNPGNITIYDEIPAIIEESERLDAEGVKIIIILGHSGFSLDKEIAAKVPLADLVIGGHSNTFLWNGPQVYEEVPEGPYPLVITQDSGKKVPVVQAYAFTKYLGRLNVTFNEEGELTEFFGQPEYLGSDVPQDKDVLDVLETFRPQVNLLTNQVIGSSKVFLDGIFEHCRSGECNFGNLVADSFVYYMANQNFGKTASWTTVPISFYNSGNFRNSINVTNTEGKISKGELYGCLPFNNNMLTYSLKGSVFYDIFEVSATYNAKDIRSGCFLQVSGVRVVYNMKKPIGKRVVSLKVRCGDCNVPVYEPVVLNKTYRVISTDFIQQGGDGYTVLKHAAFDIEEVDMRSTDIVEWYINKLSPVYPEIQGRSIFLNETDLDTSGSGNLRFEGFNVILLAFITFWVIA